MDAGKICSKCKIWKPVSDYARGSDCKLGVKSRCKLCHNHDNRQYRAAHPEAFRAYVAHKKAINPNHFRDYRRGWYERNPEKKVQHLEKLQRWNKANPKRHNERTQRRRARLRQRFPVWADSKAIAKFYEACPKNWCVDHVAPLGGDTICGFHHEANLQLVPATMNLAKGNRFDSPQVGYDPPEIWIFTREK